MAADHLLKKNLENRNAIFLLFDCLTSKKKVQMLSV